MRRREFIKTGLSTVAAGMMQESAFADRVSSSGTMNGCQVVKKGSEIELASARFSLTLDSSDGLATRSWENKLSGRTIPFIGASELEVDLDAAESRVQIPGWKGAVSNADSTDPNTDSGYRAGFFQPGFDDSKWRGMINLTLGEEAPSRFTWARTLVAIPASAEGKDLSLTLGGFGLFDHRYMRIFVNGHEVASRRVEGRWHEPLNVQLGPGSAAHQFMRYGQENLIAVQLSEFVHRTTHLDELDPLHGRSLPGSLTWPDSPAQCEQYLTIGLRFVSVGSPRNDLAWEPARLVSKRDGAVGEAVFRLISKGAGIEALVTYRWHADSPVVQKFVQISNDSAKTVRVLNVRLGSYSTELVVSDGEQGFPVYIEQDYFVGLAHAYGFAIGAQGKVQLRHYPGARLLPGTKLECMEAVYGVAAPGQGRNAFLSYLELRMRRVVRGHDRPYAIFEPFGAQTHGKDVFKETDEFLLKNIALVGEGQRDSGCHFDFYSLEFWVDYHGDLTQPDPVRFPQGFGNLKRELKKLNTSLGLWIDSSWEHWSIGGNPAVQLTLSNDPAYGKEWMALCRATEPVKSLFERGFRYHVRENGVRMVKFDNFRPLCYNPNHEHLPGVYSTEAIGNAVIETLQGVAAENQDTFLMLYWGYKSPWWLLHADTLFESGLAMEASSPGPVPMLHARDSVTVGLDAGQWYCEDVPRLGKDSLGVWLSDWSWNSSIGTERWQEGMVMDLCRGSLLVQPWSDPEWLSPPERKQMADFIALVKERADCFRRSSFILGSPWKNEPYGYICTNGKRAFLALNNCTWNDVTVELQLNESWGLTASGGWNLYRWHPDPAQLRDSQGSVGKTARYALRPFEVVFLEVVPAAMAPSLGRKFSAAPIPKAFEDPSRELTVVTNRTEEMAAVQGEVPRCSHGGTLVITTELRKGFAAVLAKDAGTHFSCSGTIRGELVEPHPVLGKATYPAAWQAWRIPIEPFAIPQTFQFSIANNIDRDAEMLCRAYFLPR